MERTWPRDSRQLLHGAPKLGVLGGQRGRGGESGPGLQQSGRGGGWGEAVQEGGAAGLVASSRWVDDLPRHLHPQDLPGLRHFPWSQRIFTAAPGLALTLFCPHVLGEENETLGAHVSRPVWPT